MERARRARAPRGARALLGARRRVLRWHAIATTSVVSEHHEWLHFTWRIVTAEGASALDGFDVGERDEDGRLRRIVGFFAPPPA